MKIDNLLLKCYYTANPKDTIGSTQMITEGTMMKTSYQNLITIEPGKRGGRACIRGMRITVSDVLSYLAAGMTRQEILDDFPYLTEEDIQACLNYAANREHQTWVSENNGPHPLTPSPNNGRGGIFKNKSSFGLIVMLKTN